MAPAIPVSFAGHKDSKKRSFSEMTGKARRFSRGHSFGFNPDYRHGVENMVDFDGTGSSAQIDTAMTASEDSFATKKRSFSLNADRYGSYGIQKEVFPFSKMSRVERKDLIYKLRMELELVQELRQKLASIAPDVVMVSPNTDIQPSNGRHKKALQENFERPVCSQGKKRPAARNDTSRQKKGTAMRPGTAMHPYPAGTTGTSVALVMKQCETLLNRLMTHQYGWVFNAPVDPVKLKIPDYFTVIKHPMDFGTVKKRLDLGEYVSPLEFAADVRLTFSNAMTYNPSSNDVHGMAKTLSKFFETRWKTIEKKISVMEQPLVPSIGSDFMVSRNTAILPSTVEEVVIDNEVKSEPPRRVMTDEEKKRLNAELEPLLEELPENIVDFLKEQSFGDGQSGEDEIEIDIDALSHETLFKLRKLLDDYLVDKQKSLAKVEPCEMEIMHDSGFSNSPIQPGGDDGLVDEDVDILGGNDPPVTSHSFISMENKPAQRLGNSSSSSSSSESGSSSNDADSDSSSRREANNAKASTTPDAAKASTVPAKALLSSSVQMDKMVFRENVEETANDGGVQNPEKQSLVGSKYVELNSKEPVTSEADSCKEGEGVLVERQISPEKQYRAALLKNRFADTILKAREKALDKGEKKDPEKLRIEREELERHRKEEKARLQAEAKVAEEAKRKAEVEAAAQAKRKREQEREAARQALQQMEQTVDINGGNQFLQDLEMLRAAARDEQPPSFMEEASPEHSQNMMGSFKMPGMSNPLEQLGLYMKMDQDEEEDEEDSEQPVPQKEVSNLLQTASNLEVDGDKRNREQEIEVACQASEQMEQTKDLNRNSQFLQDLEMPRASARDDQPLNFMEETSPKRSQNMLGSSEMLGMSNPLEELGLYMKMDQDEEEEEEQPVPNNEASNQLQSPPNLEIDEKEEEKEKNVEGEPDDGRKEGELDESAEEVQEKGGLRNALEGRELERGGLEEGDRKDFLEERKQERSLAKAEQINVGEEEHVNVSEEDGVGREQQGNLVIEDTEPKNDVGRGQQVDVVEDRDQENGMEGQHQSKEGGRQENVVVEELEEQKKVVEDGEQETSIEKMQQEHALEMGEQKTDVEEMQQENAVEEGEQERDMEEGRQDGAVEVKEQESVGEKEEQENSVAEMHIHQDAVEEAGQEERQDDVSEEIQRENTVVEMHQEDVEEEMHQENAAEEERQEGGIEEAKRDYSMKEMQQENVVEEGEKEEEMVEERQDTGMEEMHQEDAVEETHQENDVKEGAQESGMEVDMQDGGMEVTPQENAVEVIQQESDMVEGRQGNDMGGEQGNDVKEMKQETAVEEGSKE